MRRASARKMQFAKLDSNYLVNSLSLVLHLQERILEERITNIAVRRAELQRMTIKSLQDMCDQRNLTRTGSKANLIQRLLTTELTSGL